MMGSSDLCKNSIARSMCKGEQTRNGRKPEEKAGEKPKPSRIRFTEAMIFARMNGSDRGMSDETENALACLSLPLNVPEFTVQRE